MPRKLNGEFGSFECGRLLGEMMAIGLSLKTQARARPPGKDARM